MTISAVGVAAALALSALPLIPTWHTARLWAIFLIGGGVVAATVGGLAFAWRRRAAPRDGLLMITSGTVTAVVAVFLIWLILLDTPSPANVGLRCEDLVASLKDRRSGDELLIYHSSEIPDGFLSARVAVRVGWLPVERTLLHVAEPFEGGRPTDSGLELEFGIGGHLRYVYVDGSLGPAER